MSDSNDSRFDELLSRYLDASLDATEEHELLHYLSDEHLASRFHEATQLDTEIAGVLAGSISNEVMIDLVLSDLGRGQDPLVPAESAPRELPVPVLVHPQPRPKKFANALLALAAVVACLLAVSAVYYYHGRGVARAIASTPATATVPKAVPETHAEIAYVRGEVSFVAATGASAVTGDQPLKGDGTIKTIGPDSRATLILADGTEIALMGDTSFTAGLEGGKRRLFLEWGIIRSNVAKQEENAPLVFATSQAIATVRGTALILIKDKAGTYLIVTEGTVALQQTTGGPELSIDAGFYGHVEEDGIFQWPIDRLPWTQRNELTKQK